MTTPRDDIAGKEPTQKQKAACERAMDFFEAQADLWADEISLVNFIKMIGDVSRGLTDRMPTGVRANFINRQEANIDALARQSFLEGFERGDALREEYSATQLDALLKEREALQARVKELEVKYERADQEADHYCRHYEKADDSLKETLVRATRAEQERDEAVTSTRYKIFDNLLGAYIGADDEHIRVAIGNLVYMIFPEHREVLQEAAEDLRLAAGDEKEK